MILHCVVADVHDESEHDVQYFLFVDRGGQIKFLFQILEHYKESILTLFPLIFESFFSFCRICEFIDILESFWKGNDLWENTALIG